MFVHRSNRVERLVDALTRVMSEPLPRPLDGETVVVHGRGLGVWLSMRLAERFGVCAGARFPFPRRFVRELFDAVLGPQPGAGIFERERLVWAVFSALPAHLQGPGFEEVARYVSDDRDGKKRFQLADRIAEVFDQYAVFRPDLVAQWEAGGEDHWQARLWRAITEAHGSVHAATLTRRLIERLRSPTLDTSVLPARVSIFGITTLPPLYVDLFAALAEHIPVHMFVVSPSREYWGELVTRRAALRRGELDGPLDGPELQVPPLLSSLGAVGRDFQRVLESRVDYDEPFGDLYEDPGEQTLLRSLQSDVLHLRRRGDPPCAPRRPLDENDDSLQIHACHGRLREVEVLHDRIVDILASRPDLEPRDIIVMMSDVEAYAPLVEAVFERDRDDPTFVPYCIADRATRGESPLLEAFHRVLELAGGRLTATEVLDLVALEPIARRFEITSDDVDVLTQWVTDAGIRWGMDAAHRKQKGQPAYEENTWRFGLDRLLVGYALPTRGRALFQGVLPYDEIEGQQGELLGKLAAFCTSLFAIVSRLETRHTPRDWQSLLGRVIDDLLVGPEDDHTDVQPIRAALDALATDAEEAGFDDVVDLTSILTLLDRRLDDDRPMRGFLAGGVTFCAMLPMRSIPFPVVCMLGMSDGDFPRRSSRVGFDLVAAHPRPGDRARRAEDRHLFLEALSSARDRVLIFYVGQSIVDDSDLPPSVVVSDLLDAIVESTTSEGDPALHEARVRRALVVRHPMQPFSPRYFGTDPDPRLFSYARDYCEGARALVGERSTEERPPLLTEPLSPLPSTETEVLDLHRVLRFFRLPAAELLRRRLGLRLDERSTDRSDREPMELDHLEQWNVGSMLLEHRLEDIDEEQSRALSRAAGVLPLGAPGAWRYDQIATGVGPLAEAIERATAGDRRSNLTVDVRIGSTRLMGTIDRLWPARQVLHQYARLNAKHLLQAWIRHLVLSVATPDEAIPTLVLGRGEGTMIRCVALRPAPDARDHLAKLLELYVIGQTEPLLLFPRSSLAFAERLAERGDAAAAYKAAREQWAARFYGERDDPYLRRLFGEEDVLQPGFSPFAGVPLRGGDFPTLAVTVFGPLLAHLEAL